MKRAALPAVAICLAAALWGLDGVVLTPRLYNLPVPFVVFLVHAVPFLVMQLFLADAYRALAKLGGRGWVYLALVALCGGVVGTLAIVTALFLVEFRQLSVVVLLQKLQPVFAIALAAIVLKERISRRFLGWAACAIAGGYLLTFGLRGPDLATDETTVRAAVWALVAAAAFGAATVLGKRLLADLDFWQATFGRYGVTTLLMAAALPVLGVGFPFAQVTRLNWLIVLTIALTTGTGAIVLYYWGLTRVRAAVAAVCELCLPLSAVLLDYLVNGARLRPAQLVGAALMLAAITRVSLRRGQEPAAGETGAG